jgi:hypothetical protein
MGAVVPGEVVDLLLRLGQVCNDVGLAVLDAQAQFAASAEALGRCWDWVNQAGPVGWLIEERHLACRDHLERLTAVYAWAAAQYAVCAVQIASRVADGEPATVPTPLPVLPSDVLTLAQIHVSLLQIPDWAGRRPVAGSAAAGERWPRRGSPASARRDGRRGESVDHVRRAGQGCRAAGGLPTWGRVPVRAARVCHRVCVRVGDHVRAGRLTWRRRRSARKARS